MMPWPQPSIKKNSYATKNFAILRLLGGKGCAQSTTKTRRREEPLKLTGFGLGLRAFLAWAIPFSRRRGLGKGARFETWLVLPASFAQLVGFVMATIAINTLTYRTTMPTIVHHWKGLFCVSLGASHRNVRHAERA